GSLGGLCMILRHLGGPPMTDPEVARLVEQGRAAEQAGDVKGAFEAYGNGVSAHPDAWELWYELGRFMTRAGQNEKANEYLDQCLSRNAQHVDAWVYKGIAIRELGKIKEAAACFHKATGLDPANAAAWEILGSTLLHGLKDAEQALICFDNALTAKPGMSSTLQKRGICFSKLGRFSEAVQSIEAGLAAGPAIAPEIGQILESARQQL